MTSHEESSALASELLRDLCRREGVQSKQLILHSDNGSPMKESSMLATMQQLGVMPSFSRPSVSNDNPYSESLFKTLKYRPQYPLKPFADITEARKWVTKLVEWYNNEHRHSAIGFVTPAKNPKRWSGNTRNWQRIEKVHLNPEKAKEGDAKDIDIQTRKVA